jgi:hypothetical protein
MSNEKRSLSLRNKTQGALGRIEALEQDIPRIVSAVNEALTRLNTQLSETVEILNAVVALNGENEVAAAVTEARKQKQEEAVAKAKASLAEGLEKGTLVALTTVTDKSILVGIEKGKDGVVVPPGRAQLSFASLLPDFKEKLLGQAVGFTVETPIGGTFELTEIYEPVTPPEAPATPEATAAEAQPESAATDSTVIASAEEDDSSEVAQ